MQQHYFGVPWAISGDLTPGGIEIGVDPSGYVSYTQGFTSNYAIDLTGGAPAKAVQRVTFNSFGNDITTALQNLQQYGCPEWIDSTDNGGTPFPYDLGAICHYSSTNVVGSFLPYISLKTNNTDTPGTTSNWQLLINAKLATVSLSGSGTWTVPNGVYLINFTMVGGGGGSTGCGSSNNAGACGGGGGWLKKRIGVNPGQTFSYACGAGGSGVAAGSNAGTGGTTTFGAYSATGGNGGNGTFDSGGSGGVGTGGDLNGYGSDGSDGSPSVSGNNWPGKSGASYFGGERRCGANGGFPGVNFGAGASAPYTVSGTTVNGQTGAAGVIIIEFP